MRTLKRCVVNQDLREKIDNTVGWHDLRDALEVKPSWLLQQSCDSLQSAGTKTFDNACVRNRVFMHTFRRERLRRCVSFKLVSPDSGCPSRIGEKESSCQSHSSGTPSSSVLLLSSLVTLMSLIKQFPVFPQFRSCEAM